jgi:hypothetical protein
MYDFVLISCLVITFYHKKGAFSLFLQIAVNSDKPGVYSISHHGDKNEQKRITVKLHVPDSFLSQASNLEMYFKTHSR